MPSWSSRERRRVKNEMKDEDGRVYLCIYVYGCIYTKIVGLSCVSTLALESAHAQWKVLTLWCTAGASPPAAAFFSCLAFCCNARVTMSLSNVAS